MASVITQAKLIPASTIAEQQGLKLKKQGNRYWTCCPFHTEKNASMCFYENGSWYCFSCMSGGDSVALLARLKNLPMKEAAAEICRGNLANIGPAAPVTRNPHSWKKQRAQALHETIKQADEYTGQYTVETADEAWDDPVFIAAIQAKAQAGCDLDELYEADQQELERLMREAGCRDE